MEDTQYFGQAVEACEADHKGPLKKSWVIRPSRTMPYVVLLVVLTTLGAGFEKFSSGFESASWLPVFLSVVCLAALTQFSLLLRSRHRLILERRPDDWLLSREINSRLTSRSRTEMVTEQGNLVVKRQMPFFLIFKIERHYIVWRDQLDEKDWDALYSYCAIQARCG